MTGYLPVISVASLLAADTPSEQLPSDTLHQTWASQRTVQNVAYRLKVKRKAIEDAAPQRPKRIVKSLAETAQLHRNSKAACKRAASAPVRLVIAEARVVRQASKEAKQVQAKPLMAALSYSSH